MENKLFLKSILEKEIDVSDEIYQKDFEGLSYKVNWDIAGEQGYQIYEQDNYTYKIGESLEDADLTISFFDMGFVRQLIGREKVQTEMGRSEGNYFLTRKDLFITTRIKTQYTNAQILIAKIPFFRWVVPNFGSSRLARPLQGVELEKIESSGVVEKEEIASLMKKILSESVDISDELYQKNFQNQVLKVNWEIGGIDGITAYQVFEKTSYNYEFGKLHEDADLTLIIDNLKFAKRFLKKDPTDFAPGLDSVDRFLIYVKIPVVKLWFKDPNTHSFILSRFPFFRDMSQQLATEEKDDRENFGGYIPVNLPLGELENVVVPYKVFESFINKASNIILRTCPCRERGECQDHAIELGCIFMGDDTLNMAISEGQGYVATKEQALEHTRKAIEDGLIPLIGRAVGEADPHGVKDTGHFLSGCFCCTCCCVGAKRADYASSSITGSEKVLQKIEGLEIKLDPVKCVGCGDCVEVCAFDAREIVEGKSTLNLDYCIGCGRCVDACPNGALSIVIKDPSYLDEFISKIESLADVEKQQKKVGT
jgi:Fe-S-cluster-containing hydrogenase component 2